MIEILSQPWHWSISGLMIVVVMFLLIYNGQKFGVSSSFQAMCSMGGAGKFFDYFDYDWRKHDWLLTFVIGTIIGGGIGFYVLGSPEPVQISSATVADLKALGFDTPTSLSEGAGFLPSELFQFKNLSTFSVLFSIVLGGFMIGFGTRYAGGCTSGHAITGLSNLQLPSLVAVIGFFIGGLTTTYILMPILFG